MLQIRRVEVPALHLHQHAVQRAVAKLGLRLQQLRHLAQERLAGMAFKRMGRPDVDQARSQSRKTGKIASRDVARSRINWISACQHRAA